MIRLAALNPDGKTANALLSFADSSDKTTRQNLEKIAGWRGESRIIGLGILLLMAIIAVGMAAGIGLANRVLGEKAPFSTFPFF